MKPIEFEMDNNRNMVMPSRGLKLIGVRFYLYEGTCMGDVRKAKCIQKSLYGRTEWFYFNKGFKIIESKNGDIEKITVEENAFDSNEYLYSRTDKWLNISVSAIVGQNGTGKSTIVDTVIRLINNLSAAIIGEEYVYSSAQHLHYIDNVYASLAVYRNNKVLVLTSKGRKLTLTTYSADVEELDKLYSETNAHVIEVYDKKDTIEILNGNEPVDKVLPPQEGLRNLLEEWFYTLVSNYSLYAYNYRDYEYEMTNKAKLQFFRKFNPNITEEDRYWLKGVFHKNDGYQTPVVIHPMREDGYINAAKVNMLGKQNLISLAFEQREVVREGGAIDHFAFPFREINQTHHIVGFFIYRKEYDTNKSFEEQWIRKRFVVSDEQASKLAGLERPIKDFWHDLLGPDYSPLYKDPTYCKAWDYLAYKTIKVIWTYKHYETVWDDMMHHYDEIQFKNDLKDLLRDSSHRTIKIRQTLAYLKYREEKGYYLNNVNVDVDKAWEWISSKIGQNLYHGNDYHQLEKEDLLPPPFVEVVLRLVDNEHYEAYKKGKADNDIIPFGGLSSGERQIAYTIGNILYHLKNLESGKQDLNGNKDHATAIKYNYVNIMLDEVELYFHPDLQRRFLGLLVDSIGGLKMDSCSGINITLITHSPFVLSDIPSSNILYLSRDKNDKLSHSTFAANIHDLFNDAFFLPNTMGTIAQRKVEELVAYYNAMRLLKEKKSSWRPLDNRTEEHKDETMSKMQYIASIVGDSYLHDELTDMVEEMLEWKKDDKRPDHEEN
jgi:predicted ATPase